MDPLGAAAVVSLGTRGRVTAAAVALGRAIAAPPRWAAATFAGAVGATLTAAAALGVFDGRTILNDASVQLIQARYFAGGELAGPPLAMPEFWSVQFMVHTEAGWVSQYPPGHAVLLAGGFVLGAPWVVPTALMGLLGLALVPAFERLLPDRAALARTAALAAAASPLLLSLAASYMNHATVAAFAALALWLALAAERGRAAWALGAGAAMGVMVATRPVSGLVIGIAVTAALWIGSPAWRGEPSDRSWLGRRLGLWVAGGLPFAAAFAWFNARFFGSPFTLGYVAASGPNHGLGFHEDPWGRFYGLTQALGFTSAELVALGRDLLGTPLPLVALVGGYLLLRPRLARGERILVAWAALPVLASALYWHHDLVFGPRMLGGAAPAWCALAALAGAALVRAVGGGWRSDVVALVLLAALGYAVAAGGPGRVTRHADRVVPRPEVPTDEPSLVFVHELWADRMGGRLAGAGLRLDSVRTLLTRYHPCQLEAAVAGRPLAEVDPICRRQNAADALGASSLTGSLWLGDLPGLPARGPMWVRDLGPEVNARLIAAYPDRVPLFLLPSRERGGERVVPYEEGVQRLWSAPGGPSP